VDAAILEERLARGEAIEDADLGDLDWQDRAHEDAAFRDCRFTDVGFSNTRLPGARFAGCRFLRCRFSHAELREASFEDCVFVDRGEAPTGCGFAFSDLQAVRFLRCDLSFAAFERSDLFSIDMELDGAKLDRADLSGAEVSGLNLLRLASFSRLRITADQQYALLSALGVDVDPERMPATGAAVRTAPRDRPRSPARSCGCSCPDCG